MIGKPLPRTDGYDKITGKTFYTADIKLPDMLYGKILASPHPHARILSIDTTKAQRLPGVKAVIIAKDTLGGRYGYFVKDKTILAQEKVRYIGEPLAAVAAVDKYIAEEALDFIELEYEEIEPIFDPLKAMESEIPAIHEELKAYETAWDCIRYGNVCSHIVINLGNIEEGFKKSDFIFEDSFKTQMVHQCYLETHTAVAAIDLAGKVTVWLSGQSAFWDRAVIAEVLRLPMTKIKVIVPPVGGAFGGKLENLAAPLCILLAQKAGKPVKIELSRKEEFIMGRPRHSTIIEIKTGVMKDGTLRARQAKLIYGTGAYADHGPGVMGCGCMFVKGPYKIQDIKIEGYCVYTNDPVAGAFRGYGNPQVTFAYESQMDAIARQLGIDPIELRIKNAVEDGDRLATGEIYKDVSLKDTLKQAARYSDWAKAKPKENMGRGVACMSWVTTGYASSAIVKVNEDGTVTVLSGAPELGQGITNVIKQIVAEELGIPLEDIALVTVDTDNTPYESGVFGDRGTYNVGMVVKQAASEVRQKLFQLASERLEANIKDLEVEDRHIHVKGSPERAVSIAELSMISHFSKGGPIAGRGDFLCETPTAPDYVKGLYVFGFPGFTFASQVAEVEVNRRTGQVKVMKVTGAHDVGRAINPMAVEGQIQGAVSIGIGYALTEEMVLDRGRVVNPSFADYKISTASEIPPVIPVIVEMPSSTGPYGAKGLGEQGLIPAAPAIANAVYDAVEIRIKELPITPEKVYRALKIQEVNKKKGDKGW